MTVLAERLTLARLTAARSVGWTGVGLGLVAFWISLPPAGDRERAS